MNPKGKRVLIIGGGITGLTLAYRLQEKFFRSKENAEIILVESTPRIGGIIETEQKDGFIFEKGPDSFFNSKPNVLSLCEDLQIENRIIGTNPDYRRSFILQGDNLIPVPKGFYLMSPIAIGPFLASPLISIFGKIRMMFDLVLPRRNKLADESLYDFVVRRFGYEAFEKIAQPMIGGIYSADPKELSLKATMPQFLELEEKYRSVILGLRQTMIRKDDSSDVSSNTSGARYGLFASFDRGMEVLTDSIKDKFRSIDLRLKSEVTSIKKNQEGWAIEINGNEILNVNTVCLTAINPKISQLIQNISPKFSSFFDVLDFGSLVTINFVFKKEQIKHSLDGMGFVVPDIENRNILACSFSSVKFPNRSPEDDLLLRVFVKESELNNFSEKNDNLMIERVMKELRMILKIHGEPKHTDVNFYVKSTPQYKVGHLERIESLEESIRVLPGLFFAGKGYRGVGISDCVVSADLTSQKVYEFLNTPSI